MAGDNYFHVHFSSRLQPSELFSFSLVIIFKEIMEIGNRKFGCQDNDGKDRNDRMFFGLGLWLG